jgi:hypothetical protein
MPALVAGIHVFLCLGSKDVDGRDKPGHEGEENAQAAGRSDDARPFAAP